MDDDDDETLENDSLKPLFGILEKINDYLNDVILCNDENLYSTVRRMDNSMKKIKAYLESDINPTLSNNDYNIMFSKKEEIDEVIEDLKYMIPKYIEKLNAILEKTNEFETTINELGSSFNKSKLKFGLKGHIKQSLKSRDELPEMTEEEQHHYEQPDEVTPYPSNGKGGKKRKTTRKTRKIRKIRK
jgi:hypothetical protein